MAYEVDAKQFRNTMGLFATGVTVISAERDGEIHGMTANAFSSLSLEPPMVLVCVSRGARLETWLEASSRFCVNLLHAHQESLSRYFAGGHGLTERPVFQFVPFAGTQRLEGAMASVACVVENIFPGGDHVIVIGKIVDICGVDENSSDIPLIFWRGQYHQLETVATVPSTL